MSFTSIAVVPPQPSTGVYGFSALNLFQTYPTRQVLIAAGGDDPPTYDPSQLTKTWADTAALSRPVDANGHVTYQSYDPSGNPILLAMTPQVAAGFNLPGYHTYAPYVIAPTDAYINNGGAMPNSPFDPDLLSDSVVTNGLVTGPGPDVVALALALGVRTGAITDGSQGGPYPLVYPADETRRAWQILVNGIQENAGTLLAEQNASGVGAPGKWTFDAYGAAKWVSGLTALTGQPNALMLVPMRALLPNEEVIQVLGGVEIARTDMTSAANPPASPAGGAPDPNIAKILQEVTDIAHADRVPGY